MKCPHCKKEHEEGTRYCPFTGKEIQVQLQSCPNPDCANHGRNALPANYLYCPLCRTSLKGTPPPPPSGSNIEYNGVILGQTTLQDLRNRNVKVKYDQGSYFALLNEEYNEEYPISAAILSVKPKELDDFMDEIISGNKDFFLNSEKKISMMMFGSLNLCPILTELYINDDCDEYEISDILEDNGWMRIESPYTVEDDFCFFVRTLPDTAGNIIFLQINLDNHSDGPRAAFFANYLKEWESYDF